jgi:RND family efflux transporter MFP subunit
MHSKQNHSSNLLQNPEPNGSELRRSPLRFWLTVSSIVLLIITGVVAGVVPRARRAMELKAQTELLSVPTVNVVSPKLGQSGPEVPLPAEIKAWLETPIYARASGYLKRRLVDIGAHVEAGQLLAEIDTPELNQELERARAQLSQAEASLELARATASRWANALKTASVSEQENAEKQADFKLKTAITESARAEVRRIEKLHAFSRVIAPFSGTITIRNVDTGDLIVAAGGKELFHLVQTHKLRVFVQVPQAMAHSISPGKSADLVLPEFPGRKVPAKVIRSAGAIATDSRTLLVELEIDNPKEEILAGSYAQVFFTQSKKVTALTLPANTIMFRAEGPQIGVVEEDGKIKLNIVKLGHDFGRTIEILAGVDVKDRVVANPPESLVSGCTVDITEMKETEKTQ